MTLTFKQEAFAQAIADGMTQADAYRSAYDAEGMADNTIYSKASVLMSDGKVAERVRELKAALSEKVLWTREMSVRALKETYETGAGSVKVAAVKELNAMHGYNEPSKLHVEGNIGIVHYPGLDDDTDD
jgi:hypothetical protein